MRGGWMNPCRAALLCLALLGVAVFMATRGGMPRAEKQLNARLEEGRRLSATVCMARWLLCLGAACVVGPSAQGAAPVGARRVRPATSFALALSAVVLATGLSNAPRLSYSLWNDELMSVNDSILGEAVPHDGWQDKRFKPVSWLEAAMGYPTPNNHIVFSVVARLVHGPARESHDPQQPYFEAWLLRLPAFAAALTGMFLWGWIVAGWFGPRVGLVAVGIMALHPWFMRFSTEARGYGLLLCLVPMLLWLADRAVRNSRKTWWLALGVVEFISLLTWPLLIHFVLWLNVAVVGLLIAGARSHLRAWLAGALLGAGLTVAAMLPLLPQLRQYLGRTGSLVADAAMPFRTFLELATGTMWRPAESALTLHPGWHQNWSERWGASPVGVTFGLSMWLALMVLGGWWLWRTGAWGRILVIVSLMPPVAMMGIAFVTDSVFLPWYLVFSLPLLVLMTAAGAEPLIEAFRCWRWASWAWPCAVLGLAVGLMGSQWWRMRQWPMEQVKEAAQLIPVPQNPAFANDQKAPLVVSFGGYLSYLPSYRRVRTFEEFVSARERARASGRGLYFFDMQHGLRGLREPRLGAMLADSSAWERLALLPGMDPQRDIAVFRARFP
jgi:hypothetical protein